MGTLQNLREVLKGLKHKGATMKYCPRCESPRLRLSSGFDFWLTPGKYVCLDCGYRGPIFLEKDETGVARKEEAPSR